jgi:hypothetical protein
MTTQDWEKLTEKLYATIKTCLLPVCGEELADAIADAYAPEIADHVEYRITED